MEPSVALPHTPSLLRAAIGASAATTWIPQHQEYPILELRWAQMGFYDTSKWPGTPVVMHLQSLSMFIYKTTELAQMTSEVPVKLQVLSFPTNSSRYLSVWDILSDIHQQKPFSSFVPTHSIYNTGPGAIC